MIIITALRDFAEGLARGVGLYLTERNDFLELSVTSGRIRRR